MRNKNCFKMLFGGALALVMASTSVFGTVGPARVEAAGNPGDPILVASFWNSDNDTSDTIYYSTDGLNFHEICEAFTDGDRNDPEYNKVTLTHHSYVYADAGLGAGESGNATLNGFQTNPKVLKLDADRNYIYNGTDPYNDETLHDPCIFYYDPDGEGTGDEGYFWMVSGYKTGTGDARRVVIMLSYSRDLIHWSFPSSGSTTNIKLTELPPVNNDRSLYYNSDAWDMVAPDITICDGKLYVCFSIGYFALHHSEDNRDNKSIYDEMYPYMAEITSITMPKYADTSDPSVTYTPDPAKMPEASQEMQVTYSDAKPVKLPCMTSGTAYYRPEGAHNHIDASIYEEGGYYYYSIKENGVTNEIWRTTDLSRVSDPNAWELVSYDVITGYEGPCLIKYGNEYFMYVDRLSGFRPTNLNGDQEAAFTTEGVHVIKASIGTTGKLDGQTGWLESNAKEIRTYKLGSNTETKTTRHGTVYVATGKAAEVVRAAARSVGYNDSDLYGSVNASDWASEGWYHKESYLDQNVFGQENVQFHKFYYVDNKRIGSSATTDLGTVREMDGNPYFFQANAGDPDRDGMMFCGYAYDGYNRGEPSVNLPVDWDYYNQVGKAAYGTANTAWYTYFYEWDGIRRKCGDENNNRLYKNGNTGNWYRLDSGDGHVVKGAFGYTNDQGYNCFLWFDQNNGIWMRGTGDDSVVDGPGSFQYWDKTRSLDGFATITLNRRNYYIDNWGSAWYFRYDFVNGNVYGPYLQNVDKAGLLPVVEFHSPKLDILSEEGHPTEGYAWYKPEGEGGLWYWYENGVRQGTNMDAQGVYGRDEASGKAINRGREIADGNILDENGNGTWFWLDSDRNGARAVGKEVWVPYIFQDEGTWTPEQMKNVAQESDECMRDYVLQCMVQSTGKWVRYDENGRMMKGWVTIEGELADIYKDQAGNRYYYDTKTGLMAKGWITMDGNKYYFDPTFGTLTIGDREIDGTIYHFDDQGILR